MSQELLNLNWHTYSDHLKEMMVNLMESNETTDVTIVCEDKTKYRAHKFVLNSCSPVFQSIINDLPQKGDSVIYLRGVLAQEMKSILQFMYLGQATFYHDRMNEFLEVAKSLEIKEISKDVDSDDADVTKSHGTNDNISQNEENIHELETNKEYINEIEDFNDVRTKIIQSHMTESGKFQCSKCDKQFVHRSHVYRHFKALHAGLSFICNECEKFFNQKIHLITHRRAVHEGVKIFKCNECERSFNKKINLITHIRGVHEGVKFPCNECDYKATAMSNLYAHRKNKH